MANNSGKGGGARKYGRNKKGCEVYAKSHRAKKNQQRRLLRHLKAQPLDRKAQGFLKEMGVAPTTIGEAVNHGINRLARKRMNKRVGLAA